MRKIDEIIIHCTDTPEGQRCDAATIRRWHIAKGWADIGYHYVIHLDGTIEVGRPLSVIGAHCKHHNDNSIGIVYVGGRDRKKVKYIDTRTEEQKRSLRILVEGLKKEFNITKVCGHRDYDSTKACPCFDVKKEGY